MIKFKDYDHIKEIQMDFYSLVWINAILEKTKNPTALMNTLNEATVKPYVPPVVLALRLTTNTIVVTGFDDK